MTAIVLTMTAIVITMTVVVSTMTVMVLTMTDIVLTMTDRRGVWSDDGKLARVVVSVECGVNLLLLECVLLMPVI